MQHRLLIIINRFVIGGQAADTIPLLYKLKDKYHVKIIYGEKEADEFEPLFLLKQYPGLDIEKIPSLKRSINPFSDFVTLYKLYSYIQKYKPHIVHTHGAKSGFLGRVAAWLWGKAVIIHTFHGHLFHSYFNEFTTKVIIWLEKSLARITDASIALSPSQQNELVRQFKIFPHNKVFEIPLGMVEPDESCLQKQDLRSLYKVKTNEVTIAIVGRIVPIKNHLDFLKVACKILETGVVNVRFFIIGDGADRSILENFLSQQGFSFSLPGSINENSKFVFTSWISDMYSVMDEIDIVALTSSNEGTPVSLIEAQLCSKPVVAYNVGGVKDTFVDNESGFLVEKGDINLFSEKVMQLINDRSLRIKMGTRGKEFCSRKYSKDAEVTAIDNLYTLLLKQHATK
ncbi:MAG TPA: glycosyltransferase [Segetibacter sp.]|jgi:glycosyltransferase involved in cell wall biosynthesis